MNTELIAAFWPNGTPCSDFTAAENAVERLTHHASADALTRFNQHVFVERRTVISGRETFDVLRLNIVSHAT